MALAGRTFEEYKPGNPKVWYSNESPSQSYLLVLLQAERLVAAGLPAVAHDRDDKAYKAILRGRLLRLPVIAGLIVLGNK